MLEKYYYDCSMYRGFTEVGKITLFQNGTVYLKWGNLSVKGPLRCVGNCTPGSIPIAARGMYIVEGGRTQAVVFYQLNAYIGYVLAVPLVFYAYALFLVAGGKLDRLYRGLKGAVLAGVLTSALAAPVAFLNAPLATLLLICGLLTTSIGAYALFKIRQWTKSILT